MVIHSFHILNLTTMQHFKRTSTLMTVVEYKCCRNGENN